MLNYLNCVQCQKKTLLQETGVEREEDEDGEETITFKRWCDINADLYSRGIH